MCTFAKSTLFQYLHQNDVIMSAVASQITSVSTVCSSVGSGADQRKHRSSTTLAFVRWIRRWSEVPAQKASNTEKFSIWLCHHGRFNLWVHCNKFNFCILRAIPCCAEFIYGPYVHSWLYLLFINVEMIQVVELCHHKREGIMRGHNHDHYCWFHANFDMSWYWLSAASNESLQTSYITIAGEYRQISYISRTFMAINFFITQM